MILLRLGEREYKKYEEILNQNGRIPYIHMPNLCFRCGIKNPQFFTIPNDEWYFYTFPEANKEVLCRDCFDEIKKLIDSGKRDKVNYPKRCARCGKLTPIPLNISQHDLVKYIRPSHREKFFCKNCFDFIRTIINSQQKIK